MVSRLQRVKSDRASTYSFVFISLSNSSSGSGDTYSAWGQGREISRPTSVGESSIDISIGDAISPQISPQEDKADVELGILSRIADTSDPDIVFEADDESDSMGSLPAASGRLMTDEEYTASDPDLENPEEEEKREDEEEVVVVPEAGRARFRTAALAVTAAVAIGAFHVIDKSNDIDETDVEMGTKGGGEGGGAEVVADEGATKAADTTATGKTSDGAAGGKAGGNDGRGAEGKAGGNDGGGGGGRPQQSNPAQ